MRLEVLIKGIVQGVGFRPTVYRYAKEFGLTGLVNNTSEGVIIEAQGKSSDLDYFISKLKKHPPSAYFHIYRNYHPRQYG